MPKNHRSTFKICLFSHTTEHHLATLSPENLENTSNFEGCRRVLTSPERYRIMLFSQSALISQLFLHYFGKFKKHSCWKTKITFPNVSLLYLLVKNCYPALLYIICAFAAEWSFKAIIPWCIDLCLMTLCSSRKLPSKVQIAEAGHLKSIF